MTLKTTSALASILISLGDDELILGHRHSEWTGYTPHIEEDVAFSSIAQDEIGHAAQFYGLVAKDSDEADQIALGRDKGEYRHAILCERPNEDWAYTLARHWLYDTADAIRLEALEESSNHDLAALVTKIRREERYHLLHATSWMKRVAHGPVEGRTKLIDAVSRGFAESGGLFEPFELEDEGLSEGWLPVASSDLEKIFLEQTADSLDELGLPTEIHPGADQSAEFVASSSGDLIAGAGDGESGPHTVADGRGGRTGRHTSDFESLWHEMTDQYRAHPGATW